MSNNSNNTNSVSFLLEDEQEKINSFFFPRKIQDENSNEEKDLDDFLLKKRKKDSAKIDLYKHFITETNNSSFCGLWIDGAKGDGISWLSEKILHTFYNKKYADVGTPKIYILKEDKEVTAKMPEISNLIGKRQFINCATKSGLMKKSLLFSLSIISILVPVVFGIIANAIKLIDVTSNLPIQIIIAVFCLFGIVGIIFSSLKSKEEKRLTDFLDTVHNIKINDDHRYKELVKLLARKISSLSTPRILIVDDFSTLHELSRNVLQKYYESKYESLQNRELWIILNTNTAVSEQSKSWNNQNEIVKFEYARLLPLKPTEKRKIVKELDLPKERSTCDIIKDVCSEYLSPTSLQEMKGSLEELQKRNEDAFRFLYLVAANAFPSDMEFKREALIEKIRYTRESKERHRYIPKVLKTQTVPDEQQLNKYFERIQFFLRHYGSEKFQVKNNVVRYTENKDERTKLQADLYHYSNGYWAMCWYFVFGEKRWKVSWIPKLVHHLKEAYCVEGESSRENMFDAHLLAIEKSMKYFLRKEIIDTIESALRLNIQEQDDTEEKLQQLATYIAFAYLNFDYLPERKRLNEIGYGLLYDFLKKDDIELAKQVLNSEKYKLLADEIIYVLIERCWEKMLFLHISDKRYTMRNTIAEIKELRTIIENYFAQNDLQRTNDTGQKIRNIALWVWINTFDIFTNKFEKERYDELVGNIENLVYSFVTYSEQHINCRNDIEQTMLYATMQETAYIAIASILTITTASRTIKYAKLEIYLQKIISLYRLKININDSARAFDEVMKLMQLKSLVWRQGKYDNRHYNLTVIRMQLFSFRNSEYTIEDEQKYRFKDELGVIPTEHRLNTLVNFTLCNLYFEYCDAISSNYFQQACSFLDNAEFTKSQLEYMFICLVKYWANGSSLLKKVMCNFVDCEKQYADDILFYISQRVEISYLHIINTLQAFKNEEATQFFTCVLEKLKQSNIRDIELAEAIWKNFEFEQMNETEKLQNKKEYETFWLEKENIDYYSGALINLLDLENLSDTEQSNELKNKIYTFLVREGLDYNRYSKHLILACCYLDSYDRENKDGEFNRVLDIVKEQTEKWAFKNGLSDMKTIYNTLEDYTGESKYTEALFEIRLKESNNLFDSQINISAFDFLCHLCDVWLQEFVSYENINTQKYVEIVQQDDSNKRKFLNKYTHAPKVFVKTKLNDSAIDVSNAEYINAEYILVNRIINSLLYQKDENNIMNEYHALVNDCNEKANENLDHIISLIMAVNPNHTEQIQRLKEQWEEQIVYDGGDDEEGL